MTVGAKIPDWQVIYSAFVNIGMDTTSCSSSNTNRYFTFLTQAQNVGTINGNEIYSTDIPGIGISVSVYEEGNAAVKPYPSVLFGGYSQAGSCFWATVTYWKIPGEIPMNSGSITVTGPDAAYLKMSPGNTFTSSQADKITSDGQAYISSSRILTLTMLFQPGTCNIEGDNVKVNMGEYDGAGGHSAWKDASFKLLCPNGMGYGGGAAGDLKGNPEQDGYHYPYSLPTDSAITANNMKNGRVTISIVPYTEVIDANKGIIALDGTGAQGYGIQLAWGDYSSQNEVEPSNPVVLNSYVAANSLNSGFSADDTPIGGNGFSGTDNTIKMAARYVRTTGDTASGPANAVVQVIANYE